MLAVALLLAGCGSSSGDEKGMEAKFDQLDYVMATQDETNATPYNDELQKATHRYVLLVRQYADQLGPKEARRRLLAKGNEVAPFCLPCAGLLRDEARKY